MRKNKKIILSLIAAAMTIIAAVPAFAGNDFGPGMVKHFDSEEIMVVKNTTESQMMSYVITTANGNLIVVDGGLPEDAANLKKIIGGKGNRVSAWFVTHPHSDHAGALTQILEEGGAGITIDRIYYSFLDQEFMNTYESYRADFAQRVRTAIEGSGLGDIMHRGDLYDIDGVKVYCMNEPYAFTSNTINNSSVALRMQIGHSIVQFLGDLDESAGTQFLADHEGEDLKCDIVQMAHHGQCGCGRNVYEALSPTVAMWNAPGWLYDNYSGKYDTDNVRQWMKEIGVTENYSIAKGDQIIR